MPPAAQVEINIDSSRKRGPGTYNSFPVKERAREVGRVAAAAPARTSSREEALPAAVGKHHMCLPSSNVAATTAISTCPCALPEIPKFSQGAKTAGLPGLWQLPRETAAPDFLPSSASTSFACVPGYIN